MIGESPNPAREYNEHSRQQELESFHVEAWASAPVFHIPSGSMKLESHSLHDYRLHVGES